MRKSSLSKPTASLPRETCATATHIAASSTPEASNFYTLLHHSREQLHCTNRHALLDLCLQQTIQIAIVSRLIESIILTKFLANIRYRTPHIGCTRVLNIQQRHMLGQSSKLMRGMIRLVLIGDVHEYWDSRLDPAALKFLHPDAAIFVGDFGEEVVGLVKQIQEVDVPKAVILGNHDAWGALYFGGSGEKVDEQLSILGDDHVGFGSKAFRTVDDQPFTVVGGRPFSDGNTSGWGFAEKKYLFDGAYGSASKIKAEILKQPVGQPLIVVGHNGPAGLGLRRHDPCGVDFRKHQGDHGDQDLEMALKMVQDQDRNIALVTFGHMHSGLMKNRSSSSHSHKPQHRNMVDIDAETGTVYLNCAEVPRHQYYDENNRMAHFVSVTLDNGIVTAADNVWITNPENPTIVKNQALLKTVTGADGIPRRSFYKAFDDHWASEIPLKHKPSGDRGLAADEL